MIGNLIENYEAGRWVYEIREVEVEGKPYFRLYILANGDRYMLAWDIDTIEQCKWYAEGYTEALDNPLSERLPK